MFLALAIGILIGVGLGSDVVSGTTEGLEESLRGDVEEAREAEEQAVQERDREREFAEAVYPALVEGNLRGDRVVVIALGSLPEQLADDIAAAIEPAGGRLAEVAVVREPPDLRALAGAARGSRYARLRRDPQVLTEFGRTAGRQLVQGGRLIRQVRGQLLSRFSGRANRVDDVVVVREAPDEPNDREAEAIDRLEAGLLDGIREAGRPTVAVERTDTEDSSVELFDSHGISTVDHLDLVAGRVAAVSVLLGAEGNFGTRGSADELLPDLLRLGSGSER